MRQSWISGGVFLSSRLCRVFAHTTPKWAVAGEGTTVTETRDLVNVGGGADRVRFRSVLCCAFAHPFHRKY
jgi:hypothetical protein